MKNKVLSTLLNPIRDGIAATRIAEFLSDQLRSVGKEIACSSSLLVLDTGEQCTIAGCGPVYDEFIRSGQVKNYSGFGQEATTFYDDNFEAAPLRVINYDEAFYKMPYDVRTSELH